MSNHTEYNHTMTKKYRDKYVWFTKNESSGKMGIKWYCKECKKLMVYIKSIDPNKAKK